MEPFSIRGSVEWLAVCFGLAITLLIPGYTLLRYLPPLHRALGDAASRLVAALSLGVLTTPLVFLAAHLVGVPLGSRSLLALLALCLIALWLRPIILSRDQQPRSTPSPATTTNPTPRLNFAAIRRPSYNLKSIIYNLQWSSVALFGIFLASLSVRVAQAWGEPAALGSDAYHHTLISQVVIDRAGIPDDYLPYHPLGSFTYHFGFHALVAVDYWLGGAALFGAGPLTVAKLTLMVGQVLSAFAPLVAYLLTRQLTGSSRAAIVAALIPAVVEIFPGYYINWGRFTQMTGLLGLPLVMVVAVLALNREAASMTVGGDPPASRPTLQQRIWQLWANYWLAILAGVLAGGLFLAHYRIIILFYYFIACYLLVTIIGTLFNRQLASQAKIQNLKSKILKVIVLGIVNLLVVSPWLLNLLGDFSFTLAPKGGQVAQTFFSTRLSDIVSGWWFDKPLTAWLPSTAASDGKPIPPFLSNWFILSPIGILSAFGWLSGIIRRQPAVIAVGLWAAISLALSNPYWLPIPLLAGRVDYQTVVSAFWLPASLLIGYFAISIVELVAGRSSQPEPTDQPRNHRQSTIYNLQSTILIVVLAFYAGGAMAPQRESDALEAYLQPADIKAINWLKTQDIPVGTKFLVNTFTFNWSPNSRTGSDGGQWLAILGRGWQTTAPPLTFNNERALQPNFRGDTIDISILATRVDQPDAVARLRQAGIRYAYVGARSVQLGTPGLSEKPELANYREKNLHIGGTLDPIQFSKAPQLWEEIYNEDDIHIYALK